MKTLSNSAVASVSGGNHIINANPFVEGALIGAASNFGYSLLVGNSAPFNLTDAAVWGLAGGLINVMVHK